MEQLAEVLSMLGALILFAVFVAGNIEGALEYFLKPVLDWPEATVEERRGIVLREVTLVVGILVAALLGIDLLTLLAVEVGANPVSPVVGVVMTGVFMARGSNWLHDRFTNPLGAILGNVPELD